MTTRRSTSEASGYSSVMDAVSLDLVAPVNGPLADGRGPLERHVGDDVDSHGPPNAVSAMGSTWVADRERATARARRRHPSRRQHETRYRYSDAQSRCLGASPRPESRGDEHARRHRGIRPYRTVPRPYARARRPHRLGHRPQPRRVRGVRAGDPRPQAGRRGLRPRYAAQGRDREGRVLRRGNQRRQQQHHQRARRARALQRASRRRTHLRSPPRGPLRAAWHPHRLERAVGELGAARDGAPARASDRTRVRRRRGRADAAQGGAEHRGQDDRASSARRAACASTWSPATASR